jgi:two-component system, LuxR family, sensor kinase FixL
VPDLPYRVAETAAQGWTFAPLRDAQGTIVGVISTSCIVTERRRADGRLTEMSRVSKLAASAARLGTWRLDIASGRADLSDEFLELVGMDRPHSADALDALEARVYPDDVESRRLKRADAIAKRQPMDYDFRICEPGGGIRWMHTRGDFMPQSDSSPAYYYGVTMDVTERKEAEEALRSTRERLEFLLTSTWFVIYSTDTSESFRLTFVSENVSRVLGYEARHFLADPDFWRERVHPEDLPDVLESMEKAHAKDEKIAIEYRFRCGDGGYRWIHDEATISVRKGHPDQIIGYWLDVTERRRNEQEMQAHRVEMERFQQQLIVGQTLAAIAHEMNQPLNAVVSYSEAALRLLRAGNPTPDRLLQILEKSVKQGQRAGQTMRDLLALLHARQPVTRPVDLVDAVRRALQEFAAETDKAFHPMLTHTQANFPSVQVVPMYVEKVLLNLLHNAGEAMESYGLHGGAINVSVGRADEQGFMQVSVRDGGPGVAPQAAKEIFQPFYTTKARGVGMGLAISRSLIEAQGGTLWLDTGAEPGACFHFTLPLAP